MNKNIELIKKYYSSLTPSQISIADYFLKNPDKIIKSTVKSVAENAHTAVSTVDAFCKRIGFESFSDFKYRFKAEADRESFENSRAYQAFINVEKVKSTQPYNQVIKAINITNRVYIFAYQSSQVAAKDFYLRMAKLDPKKYFYSETPIEQFHMAQKIESDDVVLFISNSGRATEIKDMKQNIIKNIGTQVLVTNDQDAPLAKIVDFVLFGNNKETDSLLFNESPTTARYALIMVLEELYLRLFNQNPDYSRKQLKRATNLSEKMS